MRRNEEPTPEEIAAGHAEKIGALGMVLGLDEQFVQAAQNAGQDAVIDRAELVDETGAHGIVLLLVQRLGAFIDETLAHRGQMPKVGVIAQAVEHIAGQLGVDPQMALMLAGSVLETFQSGARRLAREASGGKRIRGRSAGA